MSFVKVSIKGVAPLLMHRFDPMAPSKPDVNAKPEEIAGFSLYKDPQGSIYQPAEHIERSLQKAGTQFKFKGKKTYMDFIKSGVFVSPDAIPHKNQNWVPDQRAVVIQRSRIMRVRPRFDEWELDFSLEVINKEIEIKKLNEIIVYAGQFIGIGDYRPRFGRFIVTKFDYK